MTVISYGESATKALKKVVMNKPPWKLEEKIIHFFHEHADGVTEPHHWGETWRMNRSYLGEVGGMGHLGYIQMLAQNTGDREQILSFRNSNLMVYIKGGKE